MAIILSGNGYNRAHASGDVRTTGLTKDDIGNAITNDLVNNVYLSKIPTPPISNVQNIRDISILVQGHKITYRVMKPPSGELSADT